MKDVQATLRRIDEEITGHTQQIARHRVEIARLQETRLVLMNLAEGDIVAAHATREERAGVINGAHAKPMLIVRKVGTGDEEGTASKALKEGRDYSAEYARRGLNKAGNKRGLKTKGNKRDGSARALYRERVLATLKDGEAMTGTELGDYFGLPRTSKERKPLQNALYYMQISGLVHRDAGKRFSLSPNGAQP